MMWARDDGAMVEAFAAQLLMDARHVVARHPAVLAHEVDDVVADILVAFAAQPQAIIEDYGVPLAFAVACCRSRVVDHHRRQRAQRGEGARTVVAEDGTPTVRRTVESLDAPAMAAAVARVEHATAFDDAVVEQVVARERLGEVLGALERADRRLLWLVHGEGRSVTEAAQAIGQSRSHVSRRLSRVLASVA